MPWWQLSLNCDAGQLDSVETLLLDHGAQSISISDARDEPIFEPLPGETPVWSHSIITGLFAADHSPENLVQSLASSLPTSLAGSLRYACLEDVDWQNSYQHHFKPVEVGKRLWIVPSWHEAPVPDAVNITLDPGMAFGTGGHATTALCLAWLADMPLNQWRVIDFGCGSGILAIAALKLGASHVQAVDIDQQAILAAEENCRINGIATEQVMIGKPEQLANHKVDLLMANILCQPLIELHDQLSGLVKAGGKILLSGILKEQVETLQSVYQDSFDLDPPQTRDDWARISGTRLS